jgi:superfamily II DNA or RNA helicase
VDESRTLSRGRQVRIAGNPPLIGTVIDAKEVEGHLLYQVFVDHETRPFVPADKVIPIDSVEFAVVEHEEFLRRLLLFKLRHPLSDTLYSYRASRTQFEVYQFRPVFKFLASDRRRLLIADEVGLGKTIEASLIYLEVKERGDLPRALVVCPSALREKWRAELKLRFDEDFTILDRRGLNQFLKDYEGTGGLQRLKGIVSLELVRDQDFQQAFVENAVALDFLIIDEAHHAKNASTETHKATRLLADRSDNALLLTATPLQTGTSDLFNLMQYLDPATFSDPQTFAYQLAPNVSVNRAIRALGQFPPDLETARAMVDSLAGYPETRENPVLGVVKERLHGVVEVDNIAAARRDLLELNSLSYVFTRTRKRDVQGTATRTATTLRVRLTPEEQAFYEEMVAQARSEVRERKLPAFIVSGRERQAASCLIATRQWLEETVRTRSDDLQLEDDSPDLDGGQAPAPEHARLQRIEELIAISRRIGTVDSKADLLLEELPALMASASGSKILLFSFYRRTIEYLRARLAAAGHRVYVIHGAIPTDVRQRTMEQFAAAEEPAILISSEVGAEGLDFQFADTLINYDLPWNPMRVEQRIGRIDRYGQLSPRIRIVSFVLEDTIETRILERLYARIRIFEESIGDLEPIVGPEITRLTREVLSRDLTPEEESRLADEAALRLANLRFEQDAFEKQASELMAPDSLFLADVTDAVEAGRVISPEEIIATLRQWFAARFPDSSLHPAEDGAWMLRADLRLAAHYADFIARSAEKSDRSIELLRAMRGTLGIPCTFDDHLAQQRRALQFIHVRHPLVRAALEYFRGADDLEGSENETRITRIRAGAPSDFAGTYTFFLNVVRVDAIASQHRFVAVAFDSDNNSRPDIAERLVRYLQVGSPAPDLPVDLENVAEANERQHLVMAEHRARLEELAVQRNDALLETRLVNVRRSFAAKILKRREWFREASNDRIRRMREAEIANLSAQLDDKIEELERGRDVRVTYELVTGGIAVLEPTLPPIVPRTDTTPRPVPPAEPAKSRQSRVRQPAHTVATLDPPSSKAPLEGPKTSPMDAPPMPDLGYGDRSEIVVDPSILEGRLPPKPPEVVRPQPTGLRRLLRFLRGSGRE